MIAKTKTNKIKKPIGVIGDIHLPFSHPGYLPFCKDTFKKWGCDDRKVCIGDMVDNHAISRYKSSADAMGAKDEYNLTKKMVKQWVKAFPNVIYTLGNHSCHDKKTEVLTKNGWKLGIDLTYEDEVATFNTDTREISYHIPMNIIKEQYSGEMYKVKNTNFDFMVTPNHRMIKVKTGKVNDYNYNIVEMKDISRSHNVLPINGKNYNIDYDIINEYLYLFGILYTDGGFKGNKLTIYQSKVNVCEKIEKCLNKLNINYKKITRIRNTTHICGKKLKKPPLPSQEYYFKNEFISSIFTQRYKFNEIFWKLSKNQFNIFFEGLVDGDGSRYKDRGKTLIIYGRYDFLSEIQRLCVFNEKKASLVKYRDKDWKLNIIEECGNIGFCKKNVTKINYDGLIWCTTIKNSTMITRRNGYILISGNSIPKRQAKEIGLYDGFLKSFKKTWDLPKGWKVVNSITINKVYYNHYGKGGKSGAYNNALDRRMSCVQGHCHSFGGVQYHANPKNIIFGMNVGCGIDCKAYAFEYGKDFSIRPTLGCGIVVSPVEAYFIPMTGKYLKY